jgi:transcription termination factor Rho
MPRKKSSAADLVGQPSGQSNQNTSSKKVPQKTSLKTKNNQNNNNQNSKKENSNTESENMTKDKKNNAKTDKKQTKSLRKSEKTSKTKSSRSTQKSSQDNTRSKPDNSHLNSIPDGDLPTETIEGVLDTSRNGHGVLRVKYSGGEMDTYISSSQMRRFNLRTGDYVVGPARRPKENERYWGLLQIDTINGIEAGEFRKMDRPKFKQLTPVYPNEHIKLEIGREPLDLRIIDMVAPIGKGQRSLIVSPPKAGKTTLLKNIATGVAQNAPEIHLMAVLVGERPEEVTDIRRHIAKITDGAGEVAASNFDESAEDQCSVAELALARAKRLVEMGQDVMILLDSITRLARAYNLAMPTSGRTLSGGFDPAALFPPKRFFGAARNFEHKGSLTIIGTALVDTGSRMDDLIYEEFKGTGNQEIHLDRRLAERRIYPAIDVQRSGTRKDELLLDSMTYQAVVTLQRMLDTLGKEERTSTLIGQLKRTDSNKEFLASLKAG